MDKRRVCASVLAGALVMALLLSLVAGFIPTAHAATSSELKIQLDALKSQKAGIDAQLAELRSQLSENSSEIEKMVA